MNDALTVGQVATLADVSVRTLHHYDAVGLVVPGGRSPAGYRTYSARDVERLYSVLTYRELGFPLTEIKEILDDPAADALEHLRRQRALLDQRIAHLTAMANAVDTVIERKTMGTNLTPAEQREIWGDDWAGERYEDEARERWGDTDAWAQSTERTAALSADDWRAIKADTEHLEADLAAAMLGGVEPGSDEANVLAERHRASIDRFYDCDHAMHVCVAGMYTADERFRAHYDRRAAGLAEWIVAVVGANAREHGA
ncbi:MerR family transcriptional regulator [Rhodococcus sp. BP-349]|uniref:MerR family transcriptional regulator n=1 Tax=unclassified Rhodococcus (in: high G+C Gram-positive bacteria) TaxID=192944 RepID=UPI001C9B33B4|nr:MULTISPECIES: MerR family transcriptional regulator [unclassified Rhodococcus (in: high G+C Gram-positive bacteria)]MBY6539125.1 MerR family transcriptional regulator [Rhodococcus sp. BP-363]MBY6544547.1 MerR family transcriptional regulator [Rhodococcus sp. BP-369]MBY6563777.1 MerR family transcriptional regulator [Rhodococcus sp. BP-370]MBY6578069.1 MerR family transcriptional regulator [Rhodococcus sp. BP-364]MBY6587370.1 MerR family transcriptional regulator [Rhodococcus sp. BP-358]